MYYKTNSFNKCFFQWFLKTPSLFCLIDFQKIWFHELRNWPFKTPDDYCSSKFICHPLWQSSNISFPPRFSFSTLIFHLCYKRKRQAHYKSYVPLPFFPPVLVTLFFLSSVQLPFSSLLFGVWPDQRGAEEGGGGLIKGKNVAIVLSRYVCICDKQKERKGERGEQGWSDLVTGVS